MIIGVDAGPLTADDERLKVGVYRLTYELLRQLSIIDKTHIYRLYSFSPLHDDVMKQFGPNMTNIVLYPKRGYMKLWLPIELMLHPVDIFLGVSQALPYMIKGKRIGFIHDLGFLHVPKTYSGSSAYALSQQTEYLIYTADHIITVSEAVKADILSHYDVKPYDISVAYEGALTNELRLISSTVITKKNNPYFLFVGSIRKGKNIPGLLQAFSLFLRKINTKYDLYLIGGDFWDDTVVNQTITKLKLSTRIKRLGYVPDNKLCSYYKNATAFVTASLSEGFCLPAAEAISCGCPVITTNNGATPEIIGDAGIVVCAGNDEALANAMYTMATNYEVREAFVQNCEIRKRLFSWESFAVHVYSLYDKV